MPLSSDWRRYFEENARSLLEVPWHIGPELTDDERKAIARSLGEFQVGESSEGRHLFHYSKAYAARACDPDYVEAMRLFIAEEQRHARDLGRFLTLNGIPLVRTTFTDRVFRRLRNLFGGLEVSIAVLVTAEIVAEVYYAALREATASQILRRLCDQILSDEAKHVEFQAGQLRRLRAGRGRLAALVTTGLQRFLFLGTVPVVWAFHRRVLSRGGLPFPAYWRESWRHFETAFAPAAGQPLGRAEPAVAGKPA